MLNDNWGAVIYSSESAQNIYSFMKEEYNCTLILLAFWIL